MRVSALRGSGALQKQFATIVVRNAGAVSCWLVGYPTVVLQAGGSALGRPATPLTAGQPPVLLRVGARAEASLHGPTTCNAGLSDHVRVTPPATATTTAAALIMRGCPLTIDPFARSR